MTPEEFKEKIIPIVERFGVDRISNDWDVAKTTVNRWVKGIACPLPRVREMIINSYICPACTKTGTIHKNCILR